MMVFHWGKQPSNEAIVNQDITFFTLSHQRVVHCSDKHNKI